jgi:hypothetical protein
MILANTETTLPQKYLVWSWSVEGGGCGWIGKMRYVKLAHMVRQRTAAPVATIARSVRALNDLSSDFVFHNRVHVPTVDSEKTEGCVP